MRTPPGEWTGRVVGLDGHDGAGKTTLARIVARRVGACYQRPFGGEVGRRFLTAGEAGHFASAIEIGDTAIRSAVAAADQSKPVILDRSWVTVASLVPWELFGQLWTCWVPTVVCWADIEVTLERLGDRTEERQSRAWHERYISRYRELAGVGDCPIVRTDDTDVTGSTERAMGFIAPLLDGSNLPPITG